MNFLANAFCLTLFLLFATPVMATMQVLNTVRYEGSQYNIVDYDPLQPILKARSIDTKAWGLTDMNTGCWRGYVADFEILNDQLYLLKIRSCSDPKIIIDLKKLFPDEYKNGKVRAWWFTGSLNIGNKPQWISYNYINYDNEMDLFIEQGKLKKAFAYDNSRTVPSKKYYEGKLALADFYKKELTPETFNQITTPISFLIINNENGTIEVIKFNDDLPPGVRDAIKEVTNKIRDWPIVYVKGKLKPISEYVYLKPVVQGKN